MLTCLEGAGGTLHSSVPTQLHRQWKTGFSDLPTKIRLKIYSKLLVLSEPIEFVADYGPPLPTLFRSRKDGLHPAILRTNMLEPRHELANGLCGTSSWLPTAFRS